MLMPWTFLRSLQLSQLVVNIFQGSQKREAFGTKINLLDCVFVPQLSKCQSHSECPIIPSCSVLQTKEIVETDANPSRYVKLIHPQIAKRPTFIFLRPRKIPSKIDQEIPETSEGRFAKQKLSHKNWGSPQDLCSGIAQKTFLQGIVFYTESNQSQIINFLKLVLAKYSILLDFGVSQMCSFGGEEF